MRALPRNVILPGDARRALPGLLAESVDCVVTSPPYFRLRDYGSAGQLGREASVAAYVDELRAVCRDLGRVLKPAGSLWLNLGDGYAKDSRIGAAHGSLHLVPQRVAVALAADGWIVRNYVIWQKPNPLPQSAVDRLSPTYEVVLFCTRRRRYYFDLDQLRVPHRTAGQGRARKPGEARRRYQGGNGGLGTLKAAGRVGHARGKNPGDVWTHATAVDRLGHQATFPEGLVAKPILATCPERICVQCDRAWRRPVRILTVPTPEGSGDIRRVGELSRCACFAPSRAGVVLDPFFGTGTVGVVAERLGRDWLGIELNPRFRWLAERRLALARDDARAA